MKKVLIINAHQHYDVVAKGELTQSYINRATEFFVKNEFEVQHTYIEKGYDISKEGDKFEWADFVLFQYPTYWMGLPWIAKKYFDETFVHGRYYHNDGRSRTDSSKTYGTGGIFKDKKYMLSITYNCPSTEFDNKKGFFEGLSVDEANIAIHKTFQFVGLKPLKTYSVHDVYKGDLDLEKELDRFEEVLKENFL